MSVVKKGNGLGRCRLKSRPRKLAAQKKRSRPVKCIENASVRAAAPRGQVQAFYAKGRRESMTLKTETPIGSGSPPVGEAKAAGARASSVKASVRVRATCLD